MRNDNANWNPPDHHAIVVSDELLTVEQIQLDRQVLISGPRALTVRSLESVGWPGDPDTDQYALVLRRDRILEINGEPRRDGWDDSIECAVSDVTDGFAVFDVSGSSSHDLLKQGGFVNPEEMSASVARQLFGRTVFLYRTAPTRYRVHISSVYAQAFRDQIKSCCAIR